MANPPNQTVPPPLLTFPGGYQQTVNRSQSLEVVESGPPPFLPPQPPGQSNYFQLYVWQTEDLQPWLTEDGSMWTDV